MYSISFLIPKHHRRPLQFSVQTLTGDPKARLSLLHTPMATFVFKGNGRLMHGRATRRSRTVRPNYQCRRSTVCADFATSLRCSAHEVPRFALATNSDWIVNIIHPHASCMNGTETGIFKVVSANSQAELQVVAPPVHALSSLSRFEREYVQLRVVA